LPIATTQITAPMPMVIPRTVGALRILFLTKKINADRIMDSWFIVELYRNNR